MPTSRDKLFGLMISKLSKINYRRVKWSRANKLYTRLVRQISRGTEEQKEREALPFMAQTRLRSPGN